MNRWHQMQNIFVNVREEEIVGMVFQKRTGEIILAGDVEIAGPEPEEEQNE